MEEEEKKRIRNRGHMWLTKPEISITWPFTEGSAEVPALGPFSRKLGGGHRPSGS